ncbi:SRPBCC family protein [Streptomyces sp. CAU 1734]|uniref:aromatase/cyclase n=1 Tax=Streptomyces sp. CAU 1734 TaxID=3140360 RepID=UPI003261772A
MSEPGLREVEHEITVEAPAPAVHQLIADVGTWPGVFPAAVHAESVPAGPGAEDIRVWAVANGQAKTWTSHRTLDAGRLRVTFAQHTPAPPAAVMRGSWTVVPLGASRCRVRLLHAYRALNDDTDALAWIGAAVDRNSRGELDAVKRAAEDGRGNTGWTFSFEDRLRVDAPAADVHGFLDGADQWPRVLPHVLSARLTEATSRLRKLTLDVRGADGSVRTVTSYRVSDPCRRITWKQTPLPALMSLHTGQWTITPAPGGGVWAAARHTVTLDPGAVAAAAGPGASPGDARRHLRTLLRTDSRATLVHARDHAEARERARRAARPPRPSPAAPPDAGAGTGAGTVAGVVRGLTKAGM